MRRVFLLVMLVLLSDKAYALKAIEGAFGYKFGGSYDKKDEVLVENSEPGTLTVAVKPPKPYKTFEFYALSLTPVTKKIYMISASGKRTSTYDCKEESKTIAELLKKKYLITDHSGPSDKITGTSKLMSGGKAIMLMCRGFTEVELMITYVDPELSKLAEKEKMTVISKEVDHSGL